MHQARGSLIDVEIAIADAWRCAAVDLGFGLVEALPSGLAAPPPYAAWIRWFGSPRGTVCRYSHAPDDELSRLHEWAEENGVYCSWLYASYAGYNRDLFVATLDDWRWFGEGKPPEWYSGKPWTTG